MEIRMAKKQNGYSLIGNDKPTRYGVMAHFDEKTKTLSLQIDLGDAAVKGAPISSTGKSKLVANTSGFYSAEFPGVPKLNLNVCATIKV